MDIKRHYQNYSEKLDEECYHQHRTPAKNPSGSVAAPLFRNAFELLIDLKPNDRLFQLGQEILFSKPIDSHYDISIADIGSHIMNCPNNTFDIVLWHDGFVCLQQDSKYNKKYIQKQMLAEIQSILRPSGQLAMTVQNRLAYSQIFTDIRTLSKKKVIGSLRTLKNILKLLFPIRDSHDSTYSYWGYRRLLKKAGFHVVDIYMAHPDHHNPLYILPMVRANVPKNIYQRVYQSNFVPSRKNGRKQTLKKFGSVAASWHFARCLGSSFFIIANANNRANEHNSFINRILENNFGRGSAGVIMMIRGTNIVVIPSYRADKDELVYLKIPLTEYADGLLKRSQNFLKFLEKKYSDEISVPQNIANGKLDNFQYYIETAIPGTSGSRIKANPEVLIRRSLQLMSSFHLQSKANGVDVAIYNWRRRLIKMSENESIKECEEFARLKDKFLRSLENLPCTVVSHNDYYLENILFDKQSNITGIIDWDLSDKNGIPAVDFLNLIINSNKRFGAKTIQNSIQQLLKDGTQKKFFKEYCQLIGIPSNLEDWLLIYLVVQVWKAIIHQGYCLKGNAQYQLIKAEIAGLIAVAKDLKMTLNT